MHRSHFHHSDDCGCSHARTQSQRAAALQRAENLCQSRSIRLTPIRRQVLQALYTTHRPLGAYDIAEIVSHSVENSGKRHLAPITIYRALDFLLAQGLAHRLTSRNAFIACPHDHGPDDMVAFLICDACGGVDEMTSPDLTQAVSALLNREHFKPETQVMEITGTCAHCQAGPASL